MVGSVSVGCILCVKVLTAERMLIVWKKQSKETKYSPDIQYSVRFCIFCWKEDKLGSIFSG